MTAHIDILEQQESLRKPLIFSAALHGAVVLSLALQGVVSTRPRELWGNPNSLGGASVGITPVSQIPLPARGGPTNPLASDTESQVPEPPPAKKQSKRAAQAEAAAIALRTRSKKKHPSRYEAVTARSFRACSSATSTSISRRFFAKSEEVSSILLWNSPIFFLRIVR